jgi:hypothetical protein
MLPLAVLKLGLEKRKSHRITLKQELFKISKELFYDHRYHLWPEDLKEKLFRSF